MATNQRSADRKLTFYFWYSFGLFVFVISAFSMRAILSTEGLPPLSLSLITHTIACTIWLAYVPMQAYLITTRRVKNHRTLGWWSIPLAVMVLITGIAISFSFLERLQDSPRFGDRVFFVFWAGVVNFIQFSAFYTLGVLKRRDLDFHKHMMLFASISLVLPAFNRIIFSFDLSRAIAPVGWTLLFLVVPVYDLIKDRKISKASWVAILLLVLQFVGSGLGDTINSRMNAG